jgi:hypothetical protein
MNSIDSSRSARPPRWPTINWVRSASPQEKAASRFGRAI